MSLVDAKCNRDSTYSSVETKFSAMGSGFCGGILKTGLLLQMFVVVEMEVEVGGHFLFKHAVGT